MQVPTVSCCNRTQQVNDGNDQPVFSMHVGDLRAAATVTFCLGLKSHRAVGLKPAKISMKIHGLYLTSLKAAQVPFLLSSFPWHSHLRVSASRSCTQVSAVRPPWSTRSKTVRRDLLQNWPRGTAPTTITPSTVHNTITMLPSDPTSWMHDLPTGNDPTTSQLAWNPDQGQNMTTVTQEDSMPNQEGLNAQCTVWVRFILRFLNPWRDSTQSIPARFPTHLRRKVLAGLSQIPKHAWTRQTDHQGLKHHRTTAGHRAPNQAMSSKHQLTSSADQSKPTTSHDTSWLWHRPKPPEGCQTVVTSPSMLEAKRWNAWRWIRQNRFCCLPERLKICQLQGPSPEGGPKPPNSCRSLAKKSLPDCEGLLRRVQAPSRALQVHHLSNVLLPTNCWRDPEESCPLPWSKSLRQVWEALSTLQVPLLSTADKPKDCLIAVAGPCHLPSHPRTWPMPSTSLWKYPNQRTTALNPKRRLQLHVVQADRSEPYLALLQQALAILDSPCHLVWGHLSASSLPGCGMPPMHGNYWKLGHPPLHPEGEAILRLTLPAWSLMSICELQHLSASHQKASFHRYLNVADPCGASLWPSPGRSHPVADAKTQRTSHPHHQFLLGGLIRNHTHP